MPFHTRLLQRVNRLPVVATVVGMFTAIVSLVASWNPSLWGDEAASLLSAERSVPSLLAMIQHVDAVHGTYYLGLHFWVELAGTSPFAIRFPSALAVGAAAAAVVITGTRMRSLAVGAIAGVVCGVLPRITYIGEEARSYAFSAAIAAWLTVILVAALTGRSRRRLWITYALLLAVGVYMFLYVALLPIAHALVLLTDRRRGLVLRRWTFATAAAVIAASPVIVLAFLERNQIAYLAHRQEVSFESVFVTIWFGQIEFAIFGWILTLGGLALALLPWLRRNCALERSQVALVVALWFLIPSGVLIGTSPLLAGFTARYLALCSPAVALLMAGSLAWLGRRWRPALAIGTLVTVLLALPSWASQRGPYAKNNSDWAVISAKMSQLANPGDAVVFDETVRPSRRTRLAMRTYPAGFAGLRDPTLKTPFWRNTTWHDDYLTLPEAAARDGFGNVSRVWLIEYALPGHVDTYGLADLERLGYTERSVTVTHRSRIIELVRARS